MTPDWVVPAKVALFAAGAVLFGLGVLTGRQALVLASLGPLLAGFVLRVVYRKPPPERHPSWEDGEEQ